LPTLDRISLPSRRDRINAITFWIGNHDGEAGLRVEDHYADVRKTIDIGSGQTWLAFEAAHHFIRDIDPALLGRLTSLSVA
jgi:hypothetical protein